MTEINSTTCCGLAEISGINDVDNVKEILQITGEADFGHEKDHHAFYLFSDTGKQTIARKLTSYIKTHGLGKVQKSIAKKNPNTQNRLIIYTWAVARRPFKQWYSKHKEVEEVASPT